MLKCLACNARLNPEDYTTGTCHECGAAIDDPNEAASPDATEQTMVSDEWGDSGLSGDDDVFESEDAGMDTDVDMDSFEDAGSEQPSADDDDNSQTMLEDDGEYQDAGGATQMMDEFGDGSAEDFGSGEGDFADDDSAQTMMDDSLDSSMDSGFGDGARELTEADQTYVEDGSELLESGTGTEQFDEEDLSTQTITEEGSSLLDSAMTGLDSGTGDQTYVEDDGFDGDAGQKTEMMDDFGDVEGDAGTGSSSYEGASILGNLMAEAGGTSLAESGEHSFLRATNAGMDSDEGSEQTFVSDDWSEAELGDLPEGTIQHMQDQWDEGVDKKARPTTSLKGRDIGRAAPRSETTQTLVIKSKVLTDAKDYNATAMEAEYELMKILGEGGMGVVYVARQTSIDRSVALKMLKAHTAKVEKHRQKFIAEAVVTGDLDHPNIVPIYDVGRREDGALFYSMKKVEGSPWQDLIAEKNLTENVEILMRVGDAMAFAHDRGVVHRDLKPENVMLGGYGEVLVMDWGLAQPTAKFRRARSIADIKSMGGTPAYMAPEMATGPINKIGNTADVYLMGAILFEIVTGKPPHRAKTARQCLMAAARNDIAMPSEDKIKDEELLNIALHAMKTEISERYQTIKEFQDAIREYQSHAESIITGRRADENFEDAEQSQDYTDFNKALFGYEQALETWSGNTHAATGLNKTRIAYATCALGNSDFELGLGLLDPTKEDHQELHSQLEEGRKIRDAHKRRVKTLMRVSMVLMGVVIVGGTIGGSAIYIKSIEAEEAAEEARASEKVAKKRKVAADMAKEDALKQKQAADIAKDDALKQKQAADIAKGEAEQSAEEARTAERKALNQEKIARAAQKAQAYQSYIAQIGLAAAKIDENAFDSAIEILKQLRKDPATQQHLNWEWGRLWYLCQQSRTFDAKQPTIAVAVSRDGKRFVTGGENGEASLWNIDNNEKPLLKLELPQRVNVFSAAFSPNDDVVVLGTDDPASYIKVFDASTGARIARTFARQTSAGELTPGEAFDVRHTSDVLSVKFSSDGKWILTGSADRTARLWDVSTGQLITSLFGHDGNVWSADFGPMTIKQGDGKDKKDGRVVTAGQDGVAFVWDLKVLDQASNSIKPVWELNEVDPMTNQLRARQPTPSAPFTGHQGAIFAAAFSPDGNFVVTGGYDKRVLMWRPSDVQAYNFNALTDPNQEVAPEPKIFAEFEGHTAIVRAVSFSVDGKLICSAGHDNSVRVWTYDSNNPGQRLEAAKVFRGHGSWVRSCKFAPQGDWVLSAALDSKIKKWSIEDYEESRILMGKALSDHSDAVMSASFAPKGNYAVTCSRDRTARTWDLLTTKRLEVFEEGHQFLTTRAMFSRDGQRLFTAAADNTLRIWDVPTGGEIETLEPTGRAAVMALSHDLVKLTLRDGTEVDAEMLVTGSDVDKATDLRRNDVRVFAVTGKKVEEVSRLRGARDEITALAVSNNGELVLGGDSKGRAYLWDRTTGELIHQLTGHAKFRISAVAFLPGDQELLTACQDNSVGCWDVKTGKEIRGKVLKHSGAVYDMAVSEDGKLVLTACQDGGVRIWNIETMGEPIVLFDRETLDEKARRLRKEAGPRGIPQDDGKNDVVIDSVAVTPDFTKAVLVSSTSASLEIWDIPSKQQVSLQSNLANFLKRGQAVWAAAFTPNGRRFVTVGGEQGQLWDVDTGDLQMDFSPHGVIASAQYSPDGKWIVTSSWDNSARVWDASTAKVIVKMVGHHTRQVNTAVFRPVVDRDAKQPPMVLTASDDGTARLWTIVTERQRNEKTGEDQDVLVAKASPNVFKGHAGPVRSAVFSPDGKFVITASDDGTARLWDIDAKQLAVMEHNIRVLSVTSIYDEAQPNVLRIATGASDSQGRIWHVDTSVEEVVAIEMLTMAGHTAGVTSVVFSVDGKRVLTASDDNTIKLWDTKIPDIADEEQDGAPVAGEDANVPVFFQDEQPAEGAAEAKNQPPFAAKEILTLAGHTREVTSVAFSPDGRNVLTASQDGSAILWLASDWMLPAGEEPAAE